MNNIESENEGFYVEFDGDYFEDKNNPVRIWTRKIQRRESNDGDAEEIPLVMIHGLAAGTALFAINFDGLAQYSVIYAIDLPGFARSSRNQFSSDESTVEAQFVESIDRWRQTLGIQKMNLLGHSFGGYLVTAYAFKHSKHIRHLVLADPWGFNDQPSREELEEKYGRSRLFYFIFGVLSKFNPLSMLRLGGRLSIRYASRVRSDLAENNRRLFSNSPEENVTLQYLTHSNCHSPTGEAAFYRLCSSFFWAKSPMRYRLNQLDPSLPLTAIYGRDSWMQSLSTEEFEDARGRNGLTLSLSVDYARHHVYARIEEFNQAVISQVLSK